MPSVKEVTVLLFPAKNSDTRIHQSCQPGKKALAPRIEGFLSLVVCSECNLLEVVYKARFHLSALVYISPIFSLKFNENLI